PPTRKAISRAVDASPWPIASSASPADATTEREADSAGTTNATASKAATSPAGSSRTSASSTCKRRGSPRPSAFSASRTSGSIRGGSVAAGPRRRRSRRPTEPERAAITPTSAGIPTSSARSNGRSRCCAATGRRTRDGPAQDLSRRRRFDSRRSPYASLLAGDARAAAHRGPSRPRTGPPDRPRPPGRSGPADRDDHGPSGRRRDPGGGGPSADRASPEPLEAPPTPRDRGAASGQPARAEEQGRPGGGPRRRSGRGRDPDRGRGGAADGPSGRRAPRSGFVLRFREGRGIARPGPQAVPGTAVRGRPQRGPGGFDDRRADDGSAPAGVVVVRGPRGARALGSVRPGGPGSRGGEEAVGARGRGLGRLRLPAHRARPQRRRGNARGRGAPRRRAGRDRRGGARPGRGPPPAGGAPRDEGPAAADRAGDPAPSRPGGEGPGDPQRLRTGLEGGGVLRPERRGGPDLASAGPGRPDEGRLPRGPDVRAERGRGGTAPRG